jgi:hypothetical protein
MTAINENIMYMDFFKNPSFRFPNNSVKNPITQCSINTFRDIINYKYNELYQQLYTRLQSLLISIPRRILTESRKHSYMKRKPSSELMLTTHKLK